MKVLLITCAIAVASCGSEAKFHDVYVYDKRPEHGPTKKGDGTLPFDTDGKDIFECEYIGRHGETKYVCTLIFPEVCE